MFTGIIEATGLIDQVIVSGSNKTFWITSPVSDELKVDQSLSHDGVCLTVEALEPGKHRVTAIEETLKKTTLGYLSAGTRVNLERCMQINSRLDGHIVQGHVDTTATCITVVDHQGSWEYRFKFDPSFAKLVIEKGSISVNGTSLTVFDVSTNAFSVAVIPYTYEHTNISQLQPGTLINLEFDIIGKYVNRIQSLATGA